MLLDRFRRPRWRHPDPEIRRQAVQRLSVDDAEEREILRALAMDDPAPGVRAVAVKRLGELPLLRERLQADPDANVRESARARYRQCLASGCGGGDLQARLTELAQCADAQVLAHLARSGREEPVRAAALERVQDAAVLAECAINDPVARLRQRAVERISDVDVLAGLAEAMRRRDTRLARVARERWQRLAAERARGDRDRDRASDLLRRLEALTGRGEHARAELLRLENLRRGLATLPADLAAELDQRLDAARRRLDDATDRARTEGARVAELVNRLDDGVVTPEAALPELETLLPGIADASGEVTERARRWLDAGRRLEAAWSALHAAEAAADAGALARALDEVDWPQNLTEPAALARARARLAELEVALPDAPPAAPTPAPGGSPPPARQAQPAALDEALSAIEADLDRGRFRSARQRLARTRRRIGENAALPRRLARRLAAASARIAEWRDWRQFAVEPKQESLCEAMEALAADAAPAAAERVARVRSLQAEWKATGGSDSAASRALWERFSAAADQALEPCREWLQREAAERQANAEARAQIRNQLTRFLTDADVEAIATAELVRIRATARSEWLSRHPVDDEDTGRIAAEFEAAMDRLTAIIEHRREAARGGREALVAQLEALLEWGDVDAAVAEAKRLQGEWQRGEQAHPRVERALWRRLRAASDALFARRAKRRGAERSEAQTRIAEAEACCEALEALVETAQAHDAGVPGGELRRVRERFAAIPLPQTRAGHGVRRRFERAARSVEECIQADRQRQWRQRVEALRELEVLCAARERGEAVAPPEWPDYLPGTVVDALKHRWAEAEAGRPVTATPQQQCRDWILRLEILAGIDSPAEDRERRLACQVERLAEGIGAGGREAPRAEAWRLAAAVLAAPLPVPELAQRFWSALTEVVARPG
jgi:hypothetical protein